MLLEFPFCATCSFQYHEDLQAYEGKFRILQRTSSPLDMLEKPAPYQIQHCTLVRPWAESSKGQLHYAHTDHSPCERQWLVNCCNSSYQQACLHNGLINGTRVFFGIHVEEWAQVFFDDAKSRWNNPTEIYRYNNPDDPRLWLTQVTAYSTTLPHEHTNATLPHEDTDAVPF